MSATINDILSHNKRMISSKNNKYARIHADILYHLLGVGGAKT